MGELSSALPTLGVIAVAIAGAFAIVHAQSRRVRGEARAETAALAERLEACIEGALPPAALRASVASAEAGVFWAALERGAHARSRPTWHALSRALAGNPHARIERQALRDESAWRRELAARRLALIHEPASRRALRRALEQGPPLVTDAAARALGRYRDPHALRWLITHPETVSARTPRARIAMLRAFGRAGLPIVAAALERTPGPPALAGALIETLGLARARWAAATIEAKLGAAEVELRVAAARALGRLRATSAGAGLARALADAAWPVRAQAAWALGRLRSRAAVPALVDRLEDRAWWVRRHAAYALAAIGPPGRNALRAAARTSSDPYAREMAREALEHAARPGTHRRSA